MKVLVAGAGGFIGGHLVRSLVRSGFDVVATDIKNLEDWFYRDDSSMNMKGDLRELDFVENVSKGVVRIYNLACDMGGMGFIEKNRAACMISVLINTNLLLAARTNDIQRYFFASSACVYSANYQNDLEVIPLRESHAYPAMPEDGYGWEKLFSERMCRHFQEDFGLKTRVARFHNVFGPFGTYDGGREKAPAAICRKVAHAMITGSQEVEIWGDGKQKRSFMWIEDCIQGIHSVMEGEFSDPVNLGSAETVSIDELTDIVEEIAGSKLKRKYISSAPQGVRARTSDNSLFRSQYGWEPSTPLHVGIAKTYDWIYEQLLKKF